MTIKRYAFIFGVSVLFLSCASCNSVTEVGTVRLDLRSGSVRPDRVLFERGMAALDKKKLDIGCLTLETLINTYPESEYAVSAKGIWEQFSCPTDQGMRWGSAPQG